MTGEILRDCLNNYIEWRLDRQEEEEMVEEVVEMVVGNPLLRDQIFRHLEPSDLKAVALVCRAWNSAVEEPRYWTWARLSLHPGNFREIFQVGGKYFENRNCF